MGRPKKGFYEKKEKYSGEYITDNFDRLVSDCVNILNKKCSRETVFCFTKEQVSIISKKAKFEVEVVEKENYFKISKLIIAKEPVLKEKKI